MNRKATGRKSIAANRRARFEYEIDDVFEAGLVLVGTEVKSLRGGKCTLGEGYVRVEDGEAWLLNVHIPEYSHGNRQNHDPKRRRKLLLHRNEIERIEVATRQKGFTCVPLEMYWNEGKAKLEIGLARGKKLHDKRQSAREKTDKREMERASRRGD